MWDAQLFQSTPSGGKATGAALRIRRRRWCFNPRLPGGRRHRKTLVLSPLRGFNPRLPGGRRHVMAYKLDPSLLFQSTPSGGKATWCCDVYLPSQTFQSTPSGGKATQRGETFRQSPQFQSTPSGGKATNRASRTRPTRQSFNPRLPGGRRPGAGGSAHCDCTVSIHAFRGEGDRIRRSPGAR